MGQTSLISLYRAEDKEGVFFAEPSIMFLEYTAFQKLFKSGF